MWPHPPAAPAIPSQRTAPGVQDGLAFAAAGCEAAAAGLLLGVAAIEDWRHTLSRRFLASASASTAAFAEALRALAALGGEAVTECRVLSLNRSKVLAAQAEAQAATECQLAQLAACSEMEGDLASFALPLLHAACTADPCVSWAVDLCWAGVADAAAAGWAVCGAGDVCISVAGPGVLGYVSGQGPYPTANNTLTLRIPSLPCVTPSDVCVCLEGGCVSDVTVSGPGEVTVAYAASPLRGPHPLRLSLACLGVPLPHSPFAIPVHSACV